VLVLFGSLATVLYGLGREFLETPKKSGFVHDEVLVLLVFRCIAYQWIYILVKGTFVCTATRQRKRASWFSFFNLLTRALLACTAPDSKVF
jgi:hypothetical protein